mmetsp:Transcript_5246/g.5703  ORF Transcript_5246/g.5703 Transcript_5246/m.5703 type:complete len:130 (-) Transcript_5246:120-509(-)
MGCCCGSDKKPRTPTREYFSPPDETGFLKAKHKKKQYMVAVVKHGAITVLDVVDNPSEAKTIYNSCRAEVKGLFVVVNLKIAKLLDYWEEPQEAVMYQGLGDQRSSIQYESVSKWRATFISFTGKTLVM